MLLNDTDPMPWGKYKGTPMANVPASYLLWLHENNKANDYPVKKYIANNFEVLKKQANEENEARRKPTT